MFTYFHTNVTNLIAENVFFNIFFCELYTFISRLKRDDRKRGEKKMGHGLFHGLSLATSKPKSTENW